ncbi:NAD(+) synthase [Desulfobacula phenolica]|uniref:NH(3)-dependent NAD(+) synthetase n=1 Tax=Desulfobacula phenolica TaxID=90732 RepID=A0A1H2IG76_9BACT|nr:NAD(+) synthase [Desulfobacula phenolica]SDU43137.1 NAD+ synthase [Desulfobacula phenolica]
MKKDEKTGYERLVMKTQKVIDHIVQWLDNYLEKSGLTGFAIGVSGGIDSAVTSTLCAKTGKPVLAVNMPIHQAKDQVSRSENHIAWLEKKFNMVKGTDLDLTPVFEQMKQSFPHHIQDGLTMANTRSRLRMLTLYAFGSNHKMLVVGTGNKVEDFGVGFYTKYGDGGVDLSPIADLMKSEVYELGKAMGIIDDILKAPPTDGLWEDERTDESQIGATYAELEWAMQYLESPQKKALTEQQKKVVSIYQKFHAANKHKMEPIPVCLIPDEFKN